MKLSNLKKLIKLDNPIRIFYHYLRAIIANIYYGNPSKDMVIIWVTGTNWKTTTTNIVAKWLKEAWHKIFMFSTINYIIADKEYVNNFKMTSPDPFILQKLLKEAKKAWCTHAVIETSSHALLFNRVWGLDYDIAILTNISQDHLDLHHTMKNYVNTKLLLFKSLISFKRKPWIKKTAIINNDTKYKDLFLDETYDNMFTYGIDIKSNIRAENIKNDINWTSFSVKIPWEILKIETKLRWSFNIDNILAAIWVFMSLSIKPRIIEKAIKWIDFIPWRMEEIENDLWFKIFVDYAHTPDALENLLNTVKDIEWKNNIIIVFWSTWDRDKTKRPIMWKIISTMADKIIVTQDDDYSEKTEDIIMDMLPWIKRKEWDNFWIITKRREAIRLWLLSAEKNDILLVVWKWDEHIMVTNDWPIVWNDKVVIKEILKELKNTK